MRKKSGAGERVLILTSISLAALFLLRSAGMVFEGAITGLGMFTAIWILFHYFPPIRYVLFKFGGITDVVVSFGLPFVIAKVMGISGGTMLIATLTCGLLFTFSVTMGRLGGPARASVSSGKVMVNGIVDQFRNLKGSFNGQLDQDTGSGRRRDHHSRGSSQCQEGKEARTEGTGPFGRVVHMIEGRDYTVKINR